MHIKYLIIVLFLFASKAICQNLITDPGFENILIKKKERNYEYQYLDWDNIVPWGKRISGIGTPKYSLYLNYLNTSKNTSLNDTVKEKINNWYKPHRGDSYFIPDYPFFTNLVQSKLTKALQKDSIYYFQMYVKVIANNFGELNLLQGKLGLWFTNHDFSDSTGQLIMQKNKLNITPPIQVKEFNIRNNEQWIKFSSTFQSDNDYNYVLLGNFEPLMEQKDEIWTKNQGITFRLDDLCMVPMWLKGSCSVYNSEDIFEIKHIYFDFNSYKLNIESINDLKEIAKYFRADKTILSLYGYADSIGTEKDNKELSLNRARAVFDFLLNNGIDSSRMSFDGEGSINTPGSNDSETERKINRRVEVKIHQ